MSIQWMDDFKGYSASTVADGRRNAVDHCRELPHSC
jgi:hypothetical protein